MIEIPEHIGKSVLLDCDEVLLGWWRGLAEFLYREHGIETCPGGPRTFGMQEWMGISDRKKIVGHIMEFNSAGGTGFERLQPLPGALEAIEALRREGYELRVITSASDEEAVRDARESNLVNVFGADAFCDLICLPMGAPKEPELRRHSPSLWIDDLEVNVREGITAGHCGVMMEASHNRDCLRTGRINDLPWARNWSQIMAALDPGPATPALASM